MICGALQTLNEEACEDVLEETEDPVITEGDIPQTSVIPPSPDINQGESHQHANKLLRDKSAVGYVEPNVTVLIPHKFVDGSYQNIGDIP